MALSSLKESQARLPAYRTHQISALPKISAMVERLDQKQARRSTHADIAVIEVWRACSGFAHGNGTVMNMILGRRVTGLDGAIGVEIEVTSSIALTAVFVDIAVSLTETLVGHYARACTELQTGQ